MVSGYIRQHQIVSSSDDSLLHSFDKARISFIFRYGSGWIPNVNDTEPWIEVNLKSVHRITAIITQGCANEDYWVTSYSVSYMTNDEWIDYIPGTVEQVIIFISIITLSYKGYSKNWVRICCWKSERHNSGIPYTPYTFRVRIRVRIRIRVRVRARVRIRVRD